MNSACRKIANVTLTAGGLALCIGTSTAAATPTAVACQPTRVKVVASDLGSCVDTTSFTSVPETAVKFVQGGANASCVVVLFTAEAANSPNETMWLRAVLDGTTSGLPAGVQFKQGDKIGSQAASFIFPSVAPGAHTIRMQYESKFGASACLGPHNTILHYAP